MAVVRPGKLFLPGSARAGGVSPFVPFYAILVLVRERSACRSSRFSVLRFYSPGPALLLLANFPLAPQPPKCSSNPMGTNSQFGLQHQLTRKAFLTNNR